MGSRLADRRLTEIPAGARATLAAAAFGPQSRAAELPGPSRAPILAGTGLGGQPRWEVGGVLGAGATAHVFAAVDANLRRPVAIKALDADGPAEREAFIEEARIAASLQHPGVMPVHELATDTDGRPWFAMKKVDGRSLAAELDQPDRGKLARVNALVSVFIDLCSALAYAHHHGVVHQDVKPDNVMLGDFGEVLLVDWGSAAHAGADGRVKDRLYGTPLYMSPEQARREWADARSDVYCLGTSLLHALTGRVPMWRDDPAEFWAAKQAGAIDLPSREERARIAPELLAIALKAVEPEPGSRYADARSMLEDLERFQAGLAVSAARDPLWRRLRRWYRANRALAWASGSALAALALAGALLAREIALSSSRWETVLVEDFNDASRPIAERWRVRVKPDWNRPAQEVDAGRYAVIEDGRLRLQQATIVDLSLRRAMIGDFRASWTARTVYQPLNLNCFIGEDRDQGWVFHVGGWSDPCRVVLTRGADGPVLADARFATGVSVGRAYRFQLEKEGQHLRLRIDGESIIDARDHREADGLGQLGFGFESASWNAVLIDDVVVERKPLAQRVSPLAVADELFRAGMHQRARDRYGELAESYRGSAIAAAAELGEAQSAARMGEDGAADSLLARFLANHPGHEHEPVALFERMLLARRRGDQAAAATLRTAVERHVGHPLLCRLLHEDAVQLRLLAERTEIATIGGNPYPSDIVERFADAYRGFLARVAASGLPISDPSLEHAFALVTMNLGRADVAERLLPPHNARQAQLLLQQGRYQEVIDRFPHLVYERGRALFESGRHDRILADPDYSWLAPEVRCERGEVDEAVALAQNPGQRARVLHASGRWSEALADGGLDAELTRDADLRLHGILATRGSTDVIAAMRGGFSPATAVSRGSYPAMYECALRLLASGEASPAKEMLDAMASGQDPIQNQSLLSAHWLLRAVLAGIEGRPEGLTAALRPALDRGRLVLGQRPYFAAALITGAIDEAAFADQPYRRHLEAFTTWCRALRDDANGRPGQAAEGYRAWLALPSWKRPASRRCDEVWAEWRVAALGR